MNPAHTAQFYTCSHVCTIINILPNFSTVAAVQSDENATVVARPFVFCDSSGREIMDHLRNVSVFALSRGNYAILPEILSQIISWTIIN